MDIDKNKEEILGFLSRVKREGMDNLIEFLTDKSDYFIAPASARFHNDIPGGLAQHSLQVMKLLRTKNKLYNTKIPDESCILTALLHDLCKVGSYTQEKGWFKNASTNNRWQSYQKYGFREDWLPFGHGEGSVIKLSRFVKLSDWEVAAILYHMGFCLPKEMIFDFNKALKMFPSIILLHTADVESGILFEKVVDPTERLWCVDMKEGSLV